MRGIERNPVQFLIFQGAICMDFYFFVVSYRYQEEVTLIVAAPEFTFVFFQPRTGQSFRPIFAATASEKVMLGAIAGILKVVLVTAKGHANFRMVREEPSQAQRAFVERPRAICRMVRINNSPGWRCSGQAMFNEGRIIR